MSVHRLQYSSSCVADDEPPSEFVIKHAVKRMLKQHHQYSEEELCEYLSSNFPEIPKSYRSTVVSAASTAAKYVSSVALVADPFRHSPDLGKSRLAESARHSLVIWNFGLQQNSSSVRDSDIPSLTQLTNRDVMVATVLRRIPGFVLGRRLPFLPGLVVQQVRVSLETTILSVIRRIP